jgi:hypothetical protein
VFENRLALVGDIVRMFTMTIAECGALASVVEDDDSIVLPLDFTDVEDALLVSRNEILVCDRSARTLLVLDVHTATLRKLQMAMKPLGMAVSARWGLVAVCGYCNGKDRSLLQFYRRDKDQWMLDRQCHLQGSVRISRLSFVHTNDPWPSSMLLFDLLGKPMMWAHFDWVRWQASVPLQKCTSFSQEVWSMVEMTPGRQWLATTECETYSLEITDKYTVSRRIEITWRSSARRTPLCMSMAMLPGIGCLSHVMHRFGHEFLYLHSGPEWRAMQGMSLLRVAWMATIHRSQYEFLGSMNPYHQLVPAQKK